MKRIGGRAVLYNGRMSRGSWGWLGRKILEGFIYSLWTLILPLVVSAILYGAGFLPVVGDLLTHPVKIRLAADVPVWLLASGVVVTAGLVMFTVRFRRRFRVASPPAEKLAPPPAGAVVPADDTALPKERWKLQMCGLAWEVSRPDLRLYRDVDVPGLTILDDSIKGPFCVSCSRTVIKRVHGSPGYGMAPSDYLEEPCGKCGHSVRDEAPTRNLLTLKTEVFKEAQRLDRRGELP